MVSVINITNGMIDDVTTERNTTFVTVTYADRTDGIRPNQTVKLIINNNTIILNENGNSVPVSALRTGMTVNATISSAMTRSIPPQATAFLIRIIRRPIRDNIAVGRILDVNRQNRNFTIIRDGNLSSILQFNVPENAMVFDRLGRPMQFSRLTPGMRVRVRHAAFMTASIPPQTTAFEIRVV